MASSSTDINAYGDLYQWGRRTDGHQCRTSLTSATLSSVDQPANGNFILATALPNDWRSPQNSNLWQGVNGLNNPCPSLYRLPTNAEFLAEHTSWILNNSNWAFFSLKLTLAGQRFYSNGSIYSEGVQGYYWSSTVSGTWSSWLAVNANGAAMGTERRANGYSVRCVKN